jgi:hypothetical protein
MVGSGIADRILSYWNEREARWRAGQENSTQRRWEKALKVWDADNAEKRGCGGERPEVIGRGGVRFEKVGCQGTVNA